ncbi:MAG: peptidyl-prolyl cis-trans isomerase [Candidatus Omnitrophica bacterium]|nr:peptidyl-prolyl cis-trans isomerase [Candidatus Omnitrophota bacterium]
MIQKLRLYSMKKLSYGIAPILILSGLLWSGCSKEEESPSPELQGIVASWDGGYLTVADCLHTFRELYTLNDVNPQKLEEFVLQAGHEWSSEKILYERALERQLDRDPVYLDRIRPLREEYSMNLLIRHEVDEPIRLTEKEVRRFYNEHKDEFMVPGSYSYYRIFFSNEKHGPEEAQKRAKECWQKLERGGNFNELLDEYTDTDSRKKYQLWGPFRPGDRPAEIEQVILETPVKTHSPVVETPPSGYMIFYPERKKETETKSFEDSKRTAYQQLFKRTREERLEAFLEELAASYQVTPHPELFDEEDVDNEKILLKIEPGNMTVSWGEFVKYAEARGAKSRAERLELFEHFGKRKLLLNHVHQLDFTDTQYFKDRFRPVERRVLSDYFMELTIDAEITPTEEEVYQFYEENLEAFRRPAMVEAWHITKAINYPMNASEQDKLNAESETYNQLMAIRTLIAEQGHSFITWAHRFSDNPDGGYLGYVSMLDMPPEWSSVVARLEDGEISQPFRVEDSFEMVLRGKLDESGVLKYELAQEKAYDLCRKSQIAKARAAHIEEILSQANYKFDYKPLADLILRLFKLDSEPPKYYLDPYKYS